MRAPTQLATSENSAQLSHDGTNVIEKIGKKSEDNEPSLYQIYEVLNFDDAVKEHRGFFSNRNNIRGNASMPALIWPVVRLVPKPPYDKNQGGPDSLKELFKSRYFQEDEWPWPFPPPVTRHTSPHNIDKRPPTEDVSFERPDSSTSAVWLAAPLFSFFILLLIGILLRKLVRCLQSPQNNTCLLIERLEEQHRSNNLDLAISPQNEDNLSVTLSVESDYSYQSDNNNDMPPPYSECSRKNIHKHPEELPPPYSTCLETLTNIDEVPQVHKTEDTPHINEANLQNTDTSNVGASNSNEESLIRTTDNGLVRTQDAIDTGNRSGE